MLFGFTLFFAALLAAWFVVRRNAVAAAGIAGGAALGIGAFLLLERVVLGLAPGEARPRRRKTALAVGTLALGCIALGLLPGSALFVLIGFSCYAGALIVTGLLEVLHA